MGCTLPTGTGMAGIVIVRPPGNGISLGRPGGSVGTGTGVSAIRLVGGKLVFVMVGGGRVVVSVVHCVLVIPSGVSHSSCWQYRQA